MAAEWEPASGVMFTWPLSIPYKLAVELAKDITTYTLVQNEENKQEALKWYSSWGIDTSKCKFIIARQGEDAWWVRDWGPHAVFTPSGKMMLGDGKYRYSTPVGTINCNDSLMFFYRTSDGHIRYTDIDDSATIQVGKGLNLEVLDLPFASTGGNVLTDGLGNAFSTCILTSENRYGGVPDEKFFVLNKKLLGISNYNILPNFEPVDIQHIDCLMKLLDEERILVLNPPLDHPHHEIYEKIIKDNLSKLKTIYNRPYQILRIDTYRYDDNLLAAYTNVLILNKTVYVPLFSIPQDSVALKTWAKIMPAYTIKGFSFVMNDEPVLSDKMKEHYHRNLGWFTSDALHCRTRAIWDKEMLYVNVKRVDKEEKENRVYATIIDYSKKGLIKEKIKLCWRPEGSNNWNEIIMINAGDTSHFFADIPATSTGNNIEYYVTACSLSGHTETMPRTAPAGFYSFSVL
jgi:agmatine/peptidylarginine deiminase